MTSDAAHDAAFDEAAALVLGASAAAPAARGMDVEPLGRAAALVAAAALALGDRRIATAALRAFAAAPALDDAAAAAFAELAARYLAATADLACMIELWPRLRDTPAPATQAIAAAIGAATPAASAAHAAGHGENSRSAAAAHEATTLRAPAAATTPTDRAAELVLATVEDVLGFRPDAPRQRVELRPKVSMGWRAAAADELVVGDAGVHFAWRCTTRGVELVVEQTAGAVPLRLVMLAALPLRRVLGVRIDAAPAALDLRHEGDHVVAPVQLSLEKRRVVEVLGDR